MPQARHVTAQHLPGTLQLHRQDAHAADRVRNPFTTAFYAWGKPSLVPCLPLARATVLAVGAFAASLPISILLRGADKWRTADSLVVGDTKP